MQVIQAKAQREQHEAKMRSQMVGGRVVTCVMWRVRGSGIHQMKLKCDLVSLLDAGSIVCLLAGSSTTMRGRSG